jgi:hypothetical protein
MKRAEVIAELAAVCIPRLEKFAEGLRSRHPCFRIKVGGGSVGSNTAFQGYNVFIDCDREGSEDPEPNCVALEICVRDLDREPALSTRDVTWGGDGIAPCDTTDHLPEHIQWSQDAINLILSTLPALESELDSCLDAWENTYPITENA